MKRFLTAEWRDLIMVNYEVAPEILAPFVPAGTVLDLDDGLCFVSLVGFMFLDTRVMDFLIPFHINFEEVNLRLYVRREMTQEIRRGVVFIKEIVPRTAIAAAARLIYGEPYERWKMSHLCDALRVRYTFERGNINNSLCVESRANLGIPAAGSHEEFIIEHYWGYTKRGPARTDEYRVEHPKWELFETGSPEINVDFGGTYGSIFAPLSGTKPFSVLLAKGSEVAVYKGERLAL